MSTVIALYAAARAVVAVDLAVDASAVLFCAAALNGELAGTIGPGLAVWVLAAMVWDGGEVARAYREEADPRIARWAAVLATAMMLPAYFLGVLAAARG